MSYVVPITVSDEVYEATIKLMKPSDKEIQLVFMRALTLYKLAKDLESSGGELHIKIKGEPIKKINVP